MPDFVKNGSMVSESSLNDLTSEYDAFIFDSFGVLNVGGEVISRAPSVLNNLKSQGKLLYVLTKYK